MSLYRHGGKRLLDLGVVVLASPFWIPLLGVIALLVRIKLGAPVFFRQPRPGQAGAIFEIFKFRSMTDTCDESGKPLPDAQRLTAFGCWLRALSLDELPELLNILRGEMSLVGPRPLMVQYLPRYSPEQARRHEILPGITGWAQVNGRNGLAWEDKFRFDVWYVDNYSLAVDAKILLLTLWKVVRKEGISAQGEATAPEFLGSAVTQASRHQQSARNLDANAPRRDLT